MHIKTRIFAFFFSATGFLFYLNTAIAGPPFVTGNPEPTEYKHIEFFLLGAFDNANDGTALQLPALETD